MDKRTPEEIADMASQVYALIPYKPEQAMSIAELCTELFTTGRDKGRLTVKRRRVLHVALTSLRNAGRIVMIGVGKATRYHRVSRKR